jgi:hypothetical protein
MAQKSERFEMRLDEELLERVDAWRADLADVPARAEAMRRLIERGLARASDHQVTFTDGEKVIALMLRDIAKGLKLPQGETDMDFVAKVIFGGHYWALKWDMQGVFHEHADKPAAVTFVVNVLDMWSFLEGAHAKLSDADKARVQTGAEPFGKLVKFSGFDGNNEADYFSIAHFIVNDMGRFSEFKGRDLNSHAPLVAAYTHMLGVFEPMRARLDGVSLSADQLVEILKARIGSRRRVRLNEDS